MKQRLLILYTVLLSCLMTVKAADGITSPFVHDPVLAYDGSRYYIYCTGQGIQVYSSADLNKWRDEPSVFDAAPQWAMKMVPGYNGHTWAPDIIFYKGKYHLFYSCSTFGKNRSAIGHAENMTLNPSDSRYKWEDKGGIVNSVPGRNEWNAIDPNVVVDGDGTPWMTFGSFWNGIKLVKLTTEMDAVAQPEEWYSLCKRMNNTLPDSLPGDDAVEAPFIYHHGGYYYLFVSFDYCCRGLKSNYKIAIGRSQNIKGPYLDKDGKSMMQDGGSILMEGDHKIYSAVGHCSVYDFSGQTYLFAHGYEIHDNGMPHLVKRKLNWDTDGWPIVMP